MNIAVDRPSILLTPAFRDEMVSRPSLVAHIQELDWAELQDSSQLALRGLKTNARIVVAPTRDVNFDDLFQLSRLYPGFSIGGLMVLQYCLNLEYPLYSMDTRMLKSARELGIVRYELPGEGNRRTPKKELMRMKIKP